MPRAVPHRPGIVRAASWGLVIAVAHLTLGVVHAQDTTTAQDTPIPKPSGDSPVLALTLQSCVLYALSNNLALQAEGINVRIAHTQVTGAESVFDPSFHSSFERVDFENPSPSFLETGVPDILAIEGDQATFDMGLRDRLQTGTSVDFTYTQVRTSTSSANRLLNPDWSSSLVLSASQPLLRGGWLEFNRSEILIAGNTETISRWQFREAVHDVILRVVQSYWNLVFLIEDVEVRKQSLDLAKEQLDINQVKVQQGVLAPLELKQNETAVYFRTAELIAGEGLVRDAEDTLRRLILPLEITKNWEVRLEPVDRSSVDESFVVPDWKDAAREALNRRPEILGAQVDLENRGIVIQQAENLMLPQLDLTGSYGVNALTGTGQEFQTSGGSTVLLPVNGDWSDNLEDLFDPEFRTWAVGLAIDIPIGNRAAKSNLLKSKYERRQALIRYRDLQNLIVQEVRESARSIETSVKTIEFTVKARESSEEQLRAGETRFDVGLATNFEVLQLQEDLAQKRRDVNRAYRDYRISRTRLERARGALLDARFLGVTIQIDEDEKDD